MKKIAIANWKMNPDSLKEALQKFESIKKFSKKYNAKVVVCPPYPYIGSLAPKNSKGSVVSLGAQDVSGEKQGPFTGEVDAKMLGTFGLKYVIIGHSERRAMGETNEMINKKAIEALDAKLTAIVCLGEKERDTDGEFYNVLKKEIEEAFEGINKNFASKIIVAYEPVWAISTVSKGAMDPHIISETIIFIRKILSDKFGKNVALKIPILYGGSVNEKNIGEVIWVGNADGVLVGKASLTPALFEKIVEGVSSKAVKK